VHGLRLRTGRVQREPEHVHLLVNFPPAAGICRLVSSLKGVSPHRLRQGFPDLHKHYRQAKRLWSGSYFAGSVGGSSISVLYQHTGQQNRPARPAHVRPPSPPA
jgi:putative transposase